MAGGGIGAIPRIRKALYTSISLRCRGPNVTCKRPLGAKDGPQLTASKETGTLVLHARV